MFTPASSPPTPATPSRLRQASEDDETTDDDHEDADELVRQVRQPFLHFGFLRFLGSILSRTRRCPLYSVSMHESDAEWCDCDCAVTVTVTVL